jgi:phage terminase small subunit
MLSLALEKSLSKTLTSQQQAFVELSASGIDIALAAEYAGYSKDRAQEEGKRLLRDPAIITAVHVAMARELAISAPVALRVLREFAGDAAVDKRIRLAAAKTLLDRAGWIAPKAVAASQGGVVPLNEMNMTQLRELADKLEGEIAGRAKEVSSATVAPSDTQAIDDII